MRYSYEIQPNLLSAIRKYACFVFCYDFFIKQNKAFRILDWALTTYLANE